MPDYSDPAPVRRQIAGDLRDQIRAGMYAPGTRLPSNVALSERYGVATETIRAALDELRGEGIVETRSTRGTFATGKPVTDIRPDLKALAEQVAELSELAVGYEDLRAKFNTLEAVVINICTRLNIEYPRGGAHDTTEKAPRRGRARR